MSDEERISNETTHERRVTKTRIEEPSEMLDLLSLFEISSFGNGATTTIESTESTKTELTTQNLSKQQQRTTLTTNRIIVNDTKAPCGYLVDTGSDVCALPPKPSELTNPPYMQNLTAANGTKINTYGEPMLDVNIGLRRSFPSRFPWKFVVADLKQPIIGLDFLRHYKLIPIDRPNDEPQMRCKF